VVLARGGYAGRVLSSVPALPTGPRDAAAQARSTSPRTASAPPSMMSLLPPPSSFATVTGSSLSLQWPVVDYEKAPVFGFRLSALCLSCPFSIREP